MRVVIHSLDRTLNQILSLDLQLLHLLSVIVWHHLVRRPRRVEFILMLAIKIYP